MNLTFAANLTKMIDAGLGREAAPPETFVAVGRTTEYTDLGPVAIASFETNVEAPLRALSISMEPIQAGTGDPSPTNVRPITGRDTVTVMRTGKNLFDYRDRKNWRVATSATARRTPRAGEFTLDGDTLTYNRNLSSEGAVFILGYLLGGVEYTFNYSPKSQLYFARINGGVSDTYTTTRFTQNTNTFTPPEDGYYEVLFYATNDTTYTFTDIQLEEGSTATAYEAPQIQTVEIQLGQTVYGGSLDVVSGEMTVDRAIVDVGSIEWIRQTNNTIAWFAKNMSLESEPIKPSTSATDHTSIQLSSYAYNGYGIVASLQNNKAIINGSVVYIRDDSCATAADFITKNTGQQMCYELATPITVTLTPEQITTLIGANNVWSDGGDVSLTYGTVRYTEGY